jgi:DNA-binding transcriptional MerR regulator
MMMGMFDQLKMVQDALKGMSPEQIKELMAQAQDSKKALEDAVQKAVAEEIDRRGLVTRDDVRAMLQEQK